MTFAFLPLTTDEWSFLPKVTRPAAASVTVAELEGEVGSARGCSLISSDKLRSKRTTFWNGSYPANVARTSWSRVSAGAVKRAGLPLSVYPSTVRVAPLGLVVNRTWNGGGAATGAGLVDSAWLPRHVKNAIVHPTTIIAAIDTATTIWFLRG